MTNRGSNSISSSELLPIFLGAHELMVSICESCEYQGGLKLYVLLILDSIELMTSGTMVITNHWLIVLYSHFLFKYIYNDLKIEMFLPINILIHYDFNCIRLLIFDPKRC